MSIYYWSQLFVGMLYAKIQLNKGNIRFLKIQVFIYSDSRSFIYMPSFLQLTPLLLKHSSLVSALEAIASSTSSLQERLGLHLLLFVGGLQSHFFAHLSFGLSVYHVQVDPHFHLNIVVSYSIESTLEVRNIVSSNLFH